MDAPLVDSSADASPAVKWGKRIAGVLFGLFILAAVLVALVKGIDPGPTGLVFVAISLTTSLIGAGLLILWIGQDKIETGRMKYLAVAQVVSLLILAAAALMIVAENDSGTSTYVLGGTSFGISGQGPTLTLNEDPTTTVVPSGSGCSTFKFANRLNSGDSYSVKLTKQASGSTCTVGGKSSGQIVADTLAITLTCAVSIGGRITGLRNDGLILANGGDRVGVPGTNTSFEFPALVPIGSSYKVTIQQQPGGQTCVVSDGEGTAVTNVASVTVGCN